MSLVGIWLALGWLVGGVLATLAVRLGDREPRPAEPCRDPSHALSALARAALWGRGASACPTCYGRRREAWPLAEVGSAAVFAALAWSFGWGLPLAVYTVLAGALVLVVLIDVRHRIIPDVITLPLFVAAMAASPLTVGLGRAALGAAVAGGVFFLLYIIARLLYPRAGALGLGDVKLAFVIGAIIGAPAALTMVVYSAVAGGILAIVLIAAGRSRRYAMPYGPSLALGALATLLLDPLVWR